jgi:hypothetical protein
MWQPDFNIEKTASAISSVELKQLLVLLTQTSNVCFRFRQVGEMWMRNHMKVNTVKEDSVLFYDDTDGKFFLVKLKNIMQFDIDNRIHHYQPHFHYDVLPSVELD